jgi:hypothetical protein
MAALDRRNTFHNLLLGTAVAVAGWTFVPETAKSLPLNAGSGGSVNLLAAELSEDQPIVNVARCRIRAQRCIWSRGRRICTWRWVWVNCSDAR